MKITKSQKRLFIILGLVLCYAVIDVFINLDQYKSLYVSSDNTSNQSSNPLIKSKPNQNIEVKTNSRIIKLSWKRDPFKSDKPITYRKKLEKPEKAQELILQAITYSVNNSFVIINDRILQVGDKIGLYRVKKIYKDKVKLTKYGQSIFLQPN